MQSRRAGGGLIGSGRGGRGRGPWRRPPQTPEPQRQASDDRGRRRAVNPPALGSEPRQTPSRSISPTAQRSSNGSRRRPPSSRRHPPAAGSRSICTDGLDGGGRAVVDGPKPSPVSGLVASQHAYRDAFEHEWRAKHENKPILKSENLALTPMVFVMWEDRHEAFIEEVFKT